MQQLCLAKETGSAAKKFDALVFGLSKHQTLCRPIIAELVAYASGGGLTKL